MKMFLGLLKLYRIDSFLLTVLSFMVTVYIVNGASFSPATVLLGLSLGVVFVNFIYSLNSYFDTDIDAINKPFRPIPSGVISKPTALKYIFALGLISVLLPFLYFENKNVFYCLYIFPLVGILYSNPVFPFKKKVLLASLLTAIVLILPATVAVLYSSSFEKHWHFIVILFFYCFVLVPLKDIEDVKGDTTFNSDNWSKIAGERKLLLFSMSGLITLIAVTLIFKNIPGLILLSGVFLCSLLVEIYFLFYKKSLVTLYRTLIICNLILLVTGLFLFAMGLAVSARL